MLFSRSTVGFILVLALVFISSPASADVLVLANGDRISGTVTSMEEGKLIFKTDLLGELTVPWDKVKSIATDEALDFYVDGKKVAVAKAVAVKEGALTVLDAKEEETEVAELSQVSSINIGPDDFRYNVRLNGGWDKSQGNTDKESVHFDGMAKLRNGDNRYKAFGEYNWGANEGSRDAYNWKAGANYDRFVTEKWYLTANALFEFDYFADLDLRTSVGPGVGYQFFDDDWTFLSLEGGVNYVWEDYREADDNDYPAGRLGLSFSQWLWKERLQIFNDSLALLGLTNTEDVIVQTTMGLRVPIVDYIYLTFQYQWDWNNTPAPGKKRTDQRYLMTVGVNFE